MLNKIVLVCLLMLTVIKGWSQSYCSPSYPNGCAVSNNRITNVKIGTIDHSPPDCIVHDYTNISTQVTAGVSIPLTAISVGWCSVGAAVDLNHDGDFDDLNEIMALPMYMANQIATYNMNITIPTGTPSGAYRLRVYNRLGNSGNGAPQDSPCGIYGYGSWDDYTLNLGLDLGADTSICAGDTITLDAYSLASTYLWNTGDTTPAINATTSGTYYVTVFNANDTLSDTITVTVNPLPIVTLGNDITIVNGTGITLNAGNPGATYLWSTGAVSQLISVNIAGSYYVTVTDANGCKGADTIKVTVSTVGIEDASKENSILKVTPNPANEWIHIYVDDPKLLKTKVNLLDAYGRLVREIIIQSKSQELSLSGLVSGVYILKMENGELIKIVKE